VNQPVRVELSHRESDRVRAILEIYPANLTRGRVLIGVIIAQALLNVVLLLLILMR